MKAPDFSGSARPIQMSQNVLKGLSQWKPCWNDIPIFFHDTILHRWTLLMRTVSMGNGGNKSICFSRLTYLNCCMPKNSNQDYVNNNQSFLGFWVSARETLDISAGGRRPVNQMNERMRHQRLNLSKNCSRMTEICNKRDLISFQFISSKAVAGSQL